MVMDLDLLQRQLLAEGIPVTHVRTNNNNEVVLEYASEVTPAQIQEAEQITAAFVASQNEQAAGASSGLVQLKNFLDSRAGDVKYADYFYRLQKNIIDLWRDKPALTDRYNGVITALKANKTNDANHLAMWNAFLDMAAVEYGLTVTAGEIVISGTVAQQAAQARSAIDCARSFMNTGVAFMNQLILNQRL